LIHATSAAGPCRLSSGPPSFPSPPRSPLDRAGRGAGGRARVVNLARENGPGQRRDNRNRSACRCRPRWTSRAVRPARCAAVIMRCKRVTAGRAGPAPFSLICRSTSSSSRAGMTAPVRTSSGPMHVAHQGGERFPSPSSTALCASSAVRCRASSTTAGRHQRGAVGEATVQGADCRCRPGGRCRPRRHGSSALDETASRARGSGCVSRLAWASARSGRTDSLMSGNASKMRRISPPDNLGGISSGCVRRGA